MGTDDIIEAEENTNDMLEKKIDINGKQHIIAFRCELNGRVFIITTERKIFEVSKDGEYKECTENDTETAFLKKYTKQPKSLDIELGY